MAFIDSSNLAKDQTFRSRVKMAMIKAAINVAAETETLAPKYLKRHGYANMILNNPDSKIEAFSHAVVAGQIITGASTDSDIEYTVNSLFDAMAGVKPSDAVIPEVEEEEVPDIEPF